jgi:hypothetical protein
MVDFAVARGKGWGLWKGHGEIYEHVQKYLDISKLRCRVIIEHVQK